MNSADIWAEYEGTLGAAEAHCNKVLRPVLAKFEHAVEVARAEYERAAAAALFEYQRAINVASVELDRRLRELVGLEEK